MLEPLTDFLASHGWSLVLSLLALHLLLSNVPSISFPQLPGSGRKDEEMREKMLRARERQQEQLQAAAERRAAEPRPAAAAKPSAEEKRKKRAEDRRSWRDQSSHLLGQEGGTYRPAKRTVRRG
ncbi:hypothetical protein TeGR_g7049 [Tetraparma gracilis]|jgi:hypothetical protein|uniref:Uncharacterized protein n=2 Tax=Tetraparma gracilis TaxID=2962635 RepID=A0ABQ6MFX7_9STRA|nr:hypothetical protein TeGR_g7049 [Tetraparma gracilis]